MPWLCVTDWGEQPASGFRPLSWNESRTQCVTDAA
jgi:hypothetical protein